jgi:hypothetical protein
MTVLISKQDVLNEIVRFSTEEGSSVECQQLYCDVNNMPAYKEPKWIPVSERLPEESTAVLIWCPERKNIYCGYLEEKQWWIFGAYFQKVPLEVIAWMPLPKPYEPQESEEV